MQHALCLVKTLLIIIQIMVQHKKSLILIYWRPLVLWKQRGCFECWKQWENICSFIIYQICYLQWGLINWLHHFGPLFFAAWWRPRNFRNFWLEFSKLLAEKEKLPCFCCKKIVAANLQDFLAEIYCKTFLTREWKPLTKWMCTQDLWDYSISGISAFIW